MTRLRKLSERLATDMLRAWNGRMTFGDAAEARTEAYALAVEVAERELRRFANAVKRPVDGWLEESEEG